MSEDDMVIFAASPRTVLAYQRLSLLRVRRDGRAGGQAQLFDEILVQSTVCEWGGFQLTCQSNAQDASECKE